MTQTIQLGGTSLELVERGQGRPLLFLHAGEGLAPERLWLELLSRHYRVIAPSHPGYGASPLIDGGAGGIDDVAYLYLDLAGELGLEDGVLVGADLGGWIAAEMMVRSTARFSCLVLVAPLGIKLRGRDERDIADMHGTERAEYLRLAWAEPAKGEADYTALCGGCVVCWANSVPTCRMPSGSISITRCRERLPPIISPGTPNSATTSRRAPRWSWSAALPPTRRYRRR